MFWKLCEQVRFLLRRSQLLELVAQNMWFMCGGCSTCVVIVKLVQNFVLRSKDEWPPMTSTVPTPEMVQLHRLSMNTHQIPSVHSISYTYAEI